ncbi:MAG: hypothetical protein DRH08_09430 [Deltaproteobacteria bacterium]|nr:MAG: hypothetical protein DRH08_09430 [Deltaproteobacteria bacterium]
MILLLLVLSACEKDLNQEYDAPDDQAVLFEYHYINHAWGYADHGWLIDAEGKMRSFEFPENFRLPDSTGNISQEDLFHNLSQCDSIIVSVEEKDLDYYTGLIAGAAEGEIGSPENIAADAGSAVLGCYLYDESKDMYQYVFLAVSGDWQQSNDAPEAGILVAWLKSIGEVFWLSD